MRRARNDATAPKKTKTGISADHPNRTRSAGILRRDVTVPGAQHPNNVAAVVVVVAGNTTSVRTTVAQLLGTAPFFTIVCALLVLSLSRSFSPAIARFLLVAFFSSAFAFHPHRALLPPASQTRYTHTSFSRSIRFLSSPPPISPPTPLIYMFFFPCAHLSISGWWRDARAPVKTQT